MTSNRSGESLEQSNDYSTRQGTRDAISIAENIKIVRGLMDNVWGSGEFWLLSKIIAENYVGHLSIGDHYGPIGVRIDIQAYRNAVPDLEVCIDDLFSVTDKVVRRFTLRGTHRYQFIGVPASGHPILLRGIAIDRLADGQLVESWIQIEDLRSLLPVNQRQ